jgi:hypothetical protein
LAGPEVFCEIVLGRDEHACLTTGTYGAEEGRRFDAEKYEKAQRTERNVCSPLAIPSVPEPSAFVYNLGSGYSPCILKQQQGDDQHLYIYQSWYSLSPADWYGRLTAMCPGMGIAVTRSPTLNRSTSDPTSTISPAPSAQSKTTFDPERSSSIQPSQYPVAVVNGLMMYLPETTTTPSWTGAP